MELKLTGADPNVFDKQGKRKMNCQMGKWSAWFSRYPHERGLWKKRFGEKNKPRTSCGANRDLRGHRSYGPVTLPFVPRDLIPTSLLNDHDLEERRQEEELLSAGHGL